MTSHIIRRILFCLVLFCSLLAHGETIDGRVIGVSDGDTLTILDAGNTQIKVRLAAIDAPEKAQSFGTRGKQKLSELCYGKRAIIKVLNTDRYGRTVGEVDCEGTNANESMIYSGFAWVYRKYAKGYAHLFALEDEARAERRGLWADANPIAPWDWRKSQRNN